MASSDRRVGVTLALCFLAAVMEGIDLQSMGVAGPMLSPEFMLGKAEFGRIVAISGIGLFIGAVGCGRLADSFGRKAMLVASMAIFGVFTVATALVHSVPALTVVRFLTGLGLGGALPNLVALISEAAGGQNKISRVVFTFAGMPIGGTIVSFVARAAAESGDWRLIFYVGGIAPLLLAAAMYFALPESTQFTKAKAATAAGEAVRVNSLKALLGEGRARASICLWVCCLLMNLMSFLLLNWLPSLNVAKGFTASDASTLQIVLNLASCVGSVTAGYMMEKRPGKLVLGGLFVGLALCLLALAWSGSNFGLTAVVVGLTGTCLFGGLYIIYGLIPTFYPTLARGVGAGASFAAGRVGAIVGPLLAGEILGAGRSAGDVLQALLPVTAIAGISAMVLLWRPNHAAEEAPAPAE